MAHTNATPNKPVTVAVRFERQRGAKESNVDYFETFTFSVEEAERMVAVDLALRQAEAEDPSSVKARSVEAIIREEHNKPEYNQAKRFYRNTGYVGVASTEIQEEEPASGVRQQQEVIAGSQRVGGVFLSAGPVSPEADWDKSIIVRESLARLPERDRQVLLAKAHEGYTEREIAAQLGISQPRVNAIYRRARATLLEILREEGVSR